jgi:hypothetical protein
LLRIELRLLARFGDHALRRLIERRTASAGEVLDLELKAAGRAEAGDRWRIEAQRDGARDLEQLRVHRGHDGRGVLLGRALVPRLEDRELHRRVRLSRPGEEIEAADRAHDLDAGRAFEDIAHLLGHRVGALKRRTVRQLDDDEEVALILDREERRGNAQRDEIGRTQRRHEQPEHRPAQGISTRTRGGVRRPVEAELNHRNGGKCTSPR